MGFQNGNDNGQMQANADKNSSSAQRTSNVSRLAKNTTHCQYGRLGKTGKKEGE